MERAAAGWDGDERLSRREGEGTLELAGVGWVIQFLWRRRLKFLDFGNIGWLMRLAVV